MDYKISGLTGQLKDLVNVSNQVIRLKWTQGNRLMDYRTNGFMD